MGMAIVSRTKVQKKPVNVRKTRAVRTAARPILRQLICTSIYPVVAGVRNIRKAGDGKGFFRAVGGNRNIPVTDLFKQPRKRSDSFTRQSLSDHPLFKFSRR